VVVAMHLLLCVRCLRPLRLVAQVGRARVVPSRSCHRDHAIAIMTSRSCHRDHDIAVMPSRS
jgi:hypothetical protein